MKKKTTRKPPRPRRQWVINPVTRVKESGKKYSRRQARAVVSNDLDES